MNHAKGLTKVIAKGIAISIGYGIAYLILRYYSFDQWALPAGLRAVCLFLLPLRYWPFIFIGDAAAVMYGRIPLENDKNWIWVYLGPFALIAGVSAAPYVLRKKLLSPQAMIRHLPIVAALFAAWGSACTVGFNEILGGPNNNTTIAFFTTRFLGNYLGALMGMLPALIWLNRHQHVWPLKKAFRDIAAATIAVALMFTYVEHWYVGGDVGRKTILMLMIGPALFLTYYHGWIGSAIGVFLVNLAIAQTMTKTGIPGAFDESAFLAQIGLSFTASAILFFGARITSHYEKAIDSGVAEEKARKISRIALLSNESDARDQVICMAQMYVLLDEKQDELIRLLRANGKHEEAFRLNSSGAQRRKLFHEHALAVYPIGIEEKGLFAVVHSQTFEDRWANGIPIAPSFDKGDPKSLSIGLQVAAYRCLCSAVVLMCDWRPEELNMRIRVWQTARRRGVYFSVSAFRPGEPQVSQAGAAASLFLDAKVSAHGGILHHHAHRISVLLAEETA